LLQNYVIKVIFLFNFKKKKFAETKNNGLL